MSERRARRAGQLGLIRGCCAGLVLLLVLIGLAAYVADRALASPDLGPAPSGPDHGDSEAAIAATVAVGLAAQLLAQPHGVVTLSEHDLTVLADAHNPHPDRYRNVAVRVRGGQLVVSAYDPVGPFSTTAVARLTVGLDPAGAPGSVRVSLTEVDAGQLALPGWIRDRIAGQLESAISLDPLFSSNPALQALRGNLECLLVAADGVRIGMHRPGSAAAPSVCQT